MKGGKRKGAGSLNKATLEKKKAEQAFTERVIKNVDRLFNAQLTYRPGRQLFLQNRVKVEKARPRNGSVS